MGVSMPIYNDITNSLMNKIQSGVLKEGDKLPTEFELCDEYHVSRPTVRSALLKLMNEGYIKRVKGCGTFVTKPKLVQESTLFIESYNQEMLDKGLAPKTEVLEQKTIPANELVATKLGIETGEKVIKIRRLRFVESFGDLPVVLTTVYIPYSIAPGILNSDLENNSLYDELKKTGISVTYVERELEVKMIYGKNARLLSVKSDAPAHFISSKGYLSDGTIIEYAESYYPAERNKFIIKINKEQ